MGKVWGTLLCVAAAIFVEGFSYATDYDANLSQISQSAEWSFDGWGFKLASGSLACTPTGDNSLAVWKAVPMGRSVVVTATVTPGSATGSRWGKAGIGIYDNSDNYWALVLLQSPADAGGKRTVELSEMLGGQWQAQAGGKSKLTVVAATGGFEWKTGEAYTLRIELGGGQISGEVDQAGEVRCRRVMKTDAPAVLFGRPIVEAGGLSMEARDLNARVDSVVLDPNVAIVPYRSASGSLPGGHATGFFHVGTISARSWLVDPFGKLTFARGVDWVTYGGVGGRYGRAASEKFGSSVDWSVAETGRLRTWGFNTLGDGCSSVTYHRGLAHTKDLALGAGFAAIAAIVPKLAGAGFPDVFDARFAQYCDLRARTVCGECRNDPWLMGYFIDNELDWYGWRQAPADLGLAYAAWRCGADHACKRALVEHLRKSYGSDIGKLNADFGTAYSSFDDLLASTTPGFAAGGRPAGALRDFVGLAAERYFVTASAAIRKYDPNHMVLGCRFQRRAPDIVWKAAGETCNIVSVNMYPHIDLAGGRAPEVVDTLTADFALCGRPIIVSEWSFPARDAVDSKGTPIPSTRGAGMRVDTQSQRAECYRIMQGTLSSLPFVVGSDYFMFADEPAAGCSSSFPENCNYGLVNEADTPYAEVVAAATQVNTASTLVHAGRISAPIPATRSIPMPGSVGSAKGKQVRLSSSPDGVVIDNGVLRLTMNRPHGTIFDTVALCTPTGAIQAGSYSPMLNLILPTGDVWLSPDRISAVSLVKSSVNAVIMDVTAERDPSNTVGYACCCRIEARAGEPFFRSRLLWIRNTNENELAIRRYFHSARSSFEACEKPSSEVDDWLGSDAWRSKDSSIEFRVAAAENDGRMSIGFSTDRSGVEHPDCARTIDVVLNPGDIWRSSENQPDILIGASARPGKEPASAAQTVAMWRSLYEARNK
ncbi:MAG: hypothetical protein P4L33_00240 [Capsulimonadaceae bacterium]|nr:hypothetical protein [Capsulimonadaceae bacterium]